MSFLRLKQIALVANELAPVVDQLEQVFGIEVCHRDPGVRVFGLENALLPIGNEVLEVVAPVEENTAAGRYLNARGGEGGYMVILHTDDQPRRRQRATERSVRIAWEHDAGDYKGMQLHPKDTGGSFLEIDHQEGAEDPAGPWWPAGPEWAAHRRTDVVTGIAAAEMQSPAAEALAERWAELLEIAPAGTAHEIALENARLRFVAPRDGRPEGLGGVDLHARDRTRALAEAAKLDLPITGNVVTICGTRFRLVA